MAQWFGVLAILVQDQSSVPCRVAPNSCNFSSSDSYCKLDSSGLFRHPYTKKQKRMRNWAVRSWKLQRGSSELSPNPGWTDTVLCKEGQGWLSGCRANQD